MAQSDMPPPRADSKSEPGLNRHIAHDAPKIYHQWSIQDYSPVIFDSLTGFFFGKEWSVYLHGDVGTRITSLAAEILAYKRFLGPPYSRSGYGGFLTPDKFRRAIMDFDTGPYRLECWSQEPILVIDDLGAVRGTEHASERMMQLICYRYDRALPTIVTSNMNLKLLSDYLDPRISSRFSQGIVLDLGDKDYRQELKGQVT